MDYTDYAFRDQGVKLYDDNPDKRAQQWLMMKLFDEVSSVLFEVLMSKGSSLEAVKKLEVAFSKLEDNLKESKTGFFLNQERYTMVDIYGLPHASRIFYLQGSALSKIYE